jgi:hypothetical protein
MESYGAFQEGEHAERIAQYNADLMYRQAEMVKQAGKIEHSRIVEAGERHIGGMKAAAGASGVTVGSFWQEFYDSAKQVEYDASLADWETNQRVWELYSSADRELYTGRLNKRAADTRGWGSLITGVADLAMSLTTMGAGGGGGGIAGGLGKVPI